MYGLDIVCGISKQELKDVKFVEKSRFEEHPGLRARKCCLNATPRWHLVTK